MLENHNGNECCSFSNTRVLSYCLCNSVWSSHQLFGLKEALEMSHLPDSCDDEDDGLSDRPPQNSLVRALARHTETLLTVLWGGDHCEHNTPHTDTWGYNIDN